MSRTGCNRQPAPPCGRSRRSSPTPRRCASRRRTWRRARSRRLGAHSVTPRTVAPGRTAPPRGGPGPVASYAPGPGSRHWPPRLPSSSSRSGWSSRTRPRTGPALPPLSRGPRRMGPAPAAVPVARLTRPRRRCPATRRSTSWRFAEGRRSRRDPAGGSSRRTSGPARSSGRSPLRQASTFSMASSAPPMTGPSSSTPTTEPRKGRRRCSGCCASRPARPARSRSPGYPGHWPSLRRSSPSLPMAPISPSSPASNFPGGRSACRSGCTPWPPARSGAPGHSRASWISSSGQATAAPCSTPRATWTR